MKMNLRKLAVENARVTQLADLLQEKNKRIAALEEELLLVEVVAELDIEEAKLASVHKLILKRTRTNDRTGVIKKAHERATHPNSSRSILAALRELATSKIRPTPLLGYDADEKSFKWDAGAELPPKYQSEKDALATISRYLKNYSGVKAQ